MTSEDLNRDIYNDPSVADHYGKVTGLQPCEELAFAGHVRQGDAVLDLGVGGGRTTPHLASNASRYVGADYAIAMVEVCRVKFPSLEFRCEDASDLSCFGNETFDAVVFSFNGIDYIRTDKARARCLLEVKRVLKSGGRFIFSSHNAKAIGVWPVYASAGPVQVIWRTLRAAGLTVMQATRVAGCAAFRNGVGYIVDPVHGEGLATLVSSPESFARETSEAGFELVEIINGLYPLRVTKYFTPWYYYVLRKP